MSIDIKTLQVISDNESKLSDELCDTVQFLIRSSQTYSPLTDVYYVQKVDNQELHGLLIDSSGNAWAPIRNIVRIIAKIVSLPLEVNDKITLINIKTMNIGCDFFMGIVEFTTQQHRYSGDYKWKWTAFPGYDRHYDKFTTFPTQGQLIHEKIKV